MLKGILTINNLTTGKREVREICGLYKMDEVRDQAAKIAAAFPLVFPGHSIQATLEIVYEKIDFATGDRWICDENGERVKEDHRTEWMLLKK